MTDTVDLFVIGAGSGGVRAANRAAGAGARVAIAEASRIGGTCVVRGCVPKKLFVFAAEFADQFALARGFGWTVGETTFDWSSLRDRVAAEVTRLSGLYRKGLEGNGVAVHESAARIIDPHTVQIAATGQVITAGRILIATGGRPARGGAADPAGLGLVSDDMFALPSLPAHLVVVGGGFIALEFAHIFARFGSKVTLLHRRDGVLSGFDADIATRVRDALAPAGIDFLPQTAVASVAQASAGLDIRLMDGRQIAASHLLWAIGRRPNTADLGLENAGVALSDAGAIIVDGDFRTTCPSVFALGDVTDRVNLTPVAIREASAFAAAQFGAPPRPFSHTNIPHAVFCQPPAAGVGLTEDAALAAGHDVEIADADFRPMRNVLGGSAGRTFMKLVIDKRTDRVLGCHMFGDGVPEMLQMVAIAVQAGLTKAQFDETCALHPTAAEELITMTRRRPGRAVA